MRVRNYVAGMAVGVIAGIAIFRLSAPGIEPVRMKLVAAEALRTPGAKTITVEFRRNEVAGVVLDGDPSVQLRLANHWQAPLKLPRLDFLVQTNQQTVMLAVPSAAQACRFLVRYRVYPVYQEGSRPYCRVLSFLQRHGLRGRFPGLSSMVLKCFEPKVRQTTFEFPLPEELPSHAVTLTGRHNPWVLATLVVAGCQFESQWPSAPDPDRWPQERSLPRR